jgi:hypothetical protein
VAEGRQRVVVHHLVLERFAAIKRLQLLELVEIQQREPGIGDRSEVAAATLDSEHAYGPPGERVRQVDF